VAGQNKSEIRLRELEGEADAARALYTDYLNRAERSTNERDIQQPDAELISLAGVPLGPAPPTKRQYLFIAMLGAILAGVIAALVRDRLEPGFRTAEQLENETGLPVLGFMPNAVRRKRALTLDTRDVAYVEAMSNVRSVLQLADVAGKPRVILITSALPQEGKTFFAISLARSVALAGGRCLLIDSDLRRPAVAATVGVSAEPGLGTLANSGMIDQLVKRDAASPLDIITAADSPSSAPALVSSAHLRALVDEARGRYDLIVIDAPPLLAFVDARVLSQIADSTVLVVRWRKTPRVLVQSAVKALRLYGSRIAGVVITQVDLSKLGVSEGSHAYVLRKYGAYFR
jgi:capsular exopolysaccharide synthesis family protein